MSRSSPASKPQPRHSLFWPSLIAGLLMAVPLGLGIWQLERLAWKTDLIQATERQIGQPPVPLPTDLADPDGLDFRRVTAIGRLVGDRVLYYTAGSPTGRAGLRALAPLQLADRELPLLVDLGWLPLDRKDAPFDLPSVEIRLEGVLRAPEPPGWLTPGNDPAANVWKWLDLPAMAAALGSPALEPVVLRAERIETADAAPALASLERGPITGALRNEHLQYAVTWFALAAGMAVVYLLFVRRHRREQGAP
ncbi:MAG: SURF1 family protein [Alphaproteobacteria bacterium]